MDVVTKSATVAPVESENPNGEFEVILSTEARDRDDENLWADEWKMPLPERIHIDGDHGRSLDKTVGSAVPRIEGNRLVAKGTYASTEYAQMVRTLVNEGHVNSLSVTYAEHKNQKGEGSVERELLNAAFVAIPANPEAIVLASKSATLEDKADGGLSASGDNPKHDDMVQAIHDAAIHLGAQCQNEIEADPGTADGANKTFYPEDLETIHDEDGRRMYRVKEIKTSASKEVGSPSESADESAAAETAEKSAVSAAAETPADDEALKTRAAAKARALEFLIKKAGEHA